MKSKLYYAVFLAIALWLGMGNGVAQGYYTVGTPIKGNGFTYLVEKYPGNPDIGPNSSGEIWVRNINNQYSDVKSVHKDGSSSAGEGMMAQFDGEPFYDKVCNIVSSVLTPLDKSNVGRDNLLMVVIINTDTGRIMEMEFRINPKGNGFVKVSPEKLYQIEEQIKSQVTFQLTEVGKRYNLIRTYIPFRGQDIGVTYDPVTKTWGRRF